MTQPLNIPGMSIDLDDFGAPVEVRIGGPVKVVLKDSSHVDVLTMEGSRLSIASEWPLRLTPYAATLDKGG